MRLKYVINSMKRRVLRTIIIALALTIGVALVGALLALVDTQRQFSLQSLGAQTGGYDLSITKNNLAESTFFNIANVTKVVSDSDSNIAQIYPRIQGSAEGRKSGAIEGQAVTFVALEIVSDKLVSVTSSANSRSSGGIGINIRIGGGGRGPGSGGGPPGGGGGPSRATTQTQSSSTTTSTRSSRSSTGGAYPPDMGQVYLDTSTAGVLGVKIGDEISLSYAVPVQREADQAAVTGGSVPRITAKFIVGGIGVLSGLSSDVSNPIVMRLEDAQAWLSEANQTNQLLVVWDSNNSTTDAKATVSSARGVAATTRTAVQNAFGTDFDTGLHP